LRHFNFIDISQKNSGELDWEYDRKVENRRREQTGANRRE